MYQGKEKESTAEQLYLSYLPENDNQFSDVQIYGVGMSSNEQKQKAAPAKFKKLNI
jgi:hypothetical protein